MRRVISLGMFLNLRFKMMTSLANIARTTASTSKFVYYKRYFKSSGIGALYEKYLILNELKTSLIFLTKLFKKFRFFLTWCERLPMSGNSK